MQKVKRLLLHDWPLHFILLITNWLPDNVIFLRLRGGLVAPFFGDCGKDLRLGRNLTFYNPSSIRLGNSVYIAYGCWFMGTDPIVIEDEVMFGPYCVLASAEHTSVGKSFRYGTPKRGSITVGMGTWIASHVTITSGSTIGRGSLIAANSVVRGVIPDYVVAAGQPAEVKKHIKVDPSKTNDTVV